MRRLSVTCRKLPGGAGPNGQNEIKLREWSEDEQSDTGCKEPPFSLDMLDGKKKRRMVDSYMSRMNTLLSVIIDLKVKSEALNDGGALKQSRQSLQKQPQRGERMNRKIAHLVTATLAIKAPIAEMLAVIGQQSVLIFSHARQRSPDHFFSLKSDPLGSTDPDPISRGKPLQLNHFDRTRVQA